MEKTLVVLAGGMGSRFGGPKQMEKVGPNHECILDYSVYDAKRYGFTKVIFVVKDDIKEEFINVVGKRIEKYIKVEYVSQKIESFRKKAWGTAHAILCCQKLIDNNFLVINSDDFYGSDAFRVASEHLDKLSGNHFALVSYDIKKTLSENGSVKRGVLNIKDGKLKGICESRIDFPKATRLSDNTEYLVSSDDRVSMNMLLFTPKFIEMLKKEFLIFLDEVKNIAEDEFLLPDVLSKYIEKNEVEVDVLNTNSKWFGMTYKEDIIYVKNSIIDMIKNHEYNYDLWS